MEYKIHRPKPEIKLYRPRIVVESNYKTAARILMYSMMGRFIKVARVKCFNLYMITIPKFIFIEVEEERLPNAYEVEEATLNITFNPLKRLQK